MLPHHINCFLLLTVLQRHALTLLCPCADRAFLALDNGSLRHPSAVTNISGWQPEAPLMEAHHMGPVPIRLFARKFKAESAEAVHQVYFSKEGRAQLHIVGASKCGHA